MAWAALRQALSSIEAKGLIDRRLRARSANGEPIVLEEAYLPAAIFPGLRTAAGLE
jgi:GntR family transcriptional regulator